MAINYWCLHIQYAWEHTAHMHAQKVMPGTFRKKCISHTTSISFLLVYIKKDLSKSENTSGGALWHYYFQYQFIYTDSSTKEQKIWVLQCFTYNLYKEFWQPYCFLFEIPHYRAQLPDVIWRIFQSPLHLHPRYSQEDVSAGLQV